MTSRVPIVLRCADAFVPRARYVLDTFFMARDIPVAYVSEVPAEGPWLLYGPASSATERAGSCLVIPHFPAAWEFDSPRAWSTRSQDQVPCLFGDVVDGDARDGSKVRFDLLANAFFFLASWAERAAGKVRGTRGLYSESTFLLERVPQDVVDLYLEALMEAVSAVWGRSGRSAWADPIWPGGHEYGVVLSHDIDFIPTRVADTVKQGVKTIARHLIYERNPMDAVRAGGKFAAALARRRDVYGCVPLIIQEEMRRGVRAAFQVAVGHRHPHDVNYYVEDPVVIEYLRGISDQGFEINLHGSYRSTERIDWYVEEAKLLETLLGKPLGSRQHFLSFEYDRLFQAQERAGIQYDMSMGYPDRIGPRAGFSHPYFPYNLSNDRPYDVVEISLFLMDVTLRSYMRLRSEEARSAIRAELETLRRKRGCASVVWHPIVFGGARDPGYDSLFWGLVDYVRETRGLPTDGRAINAHWRARAKKYVSFASAS